MSLMSRSMDIQIHESRYKVLQEEFSKPYFMHIQQTLKDKNDAGEVIYPTSQDIFAAYDLCPLDELKVVILWQDPYHWPWQAHGLSFSVKEWIKIPPSLRNIFKEIQTDIWVWPPESWDLTRWSQQWVFLLNSVLTVSRWKPASHSKISRQQFTDVTIRTISDHKAWVVFLLRGNFAKSKKDLIDASKHLILEAPHPSPFSAYTWFFGCKHFSKTNERLSTQWLQPIDR